MRHPSEERATDAKALREGREWPAWLESRGRGERVEDRTGEVPGASTGVGGPCQDRAGM